MVACSDGREMAQNLRQQICMADPISSPNSTPYTPPAPLPVTHQPQASVPEESHTSLPPSDTSESTPGQNPLMLALEGSDLPDGDGLGGLLEAH